MITVTIREAAIRAGIETAYQLQKRAGISPAVAADLWRGEKLPRLETLDNLCDVLDCDLPDLIHRNGHTKSRPQKQAVSHGNRRAKSGSVSKATRSR